MRHRKTILPLLLALCLLLAACGGTAPARPACRVVLGTDLHYLAPSLTDGGAYFRAVLDAGDGKVTEYCDEITDAFLARVLELRPEALILTGDLSFNGERESHLALAEKLAAVEREGVLVLVLPGNHDLYRSACAFRGDSAEPVPGVAAEEFREIYASFGFDEALSADDDSLSYTAQLSPGIRILMLDANTLHHPCGLSDATLGWIGEQLLQAEQDGQQMLAACHQNLFQHSMFGPGYVLNRADKLAALLEQYGVPLMLSGHMHIQHILTEGAVTEIAGSSLTMGACQFGVLEARGGSLRYETQSVPVAAWAKAQGLEDPNLLDFADYAAGRLSERTSASARRQLAALGYPPEEISAMTDYACALNYAYFSGDLSGIPALDPEGALLERWLESGSRFGSYFASFREEIGLDFRRWSSG